MSETNPETIPASTPIVDELRPIVSSGPVTPPPSYEEENFLSKVLDNEAFKKTETTGQVIRYSEQMEHNSNLDFLKWAMGHLDYYWQNVSARKNLSQKHRPVIFSDVRCLGAACQRFYRLEILVINKLIDAGIAVLGMDHSGALIPIPKLYNGDDGIDDDYDDGRPWLAWRPLKPLQKLKLQFGTQEQIAQQLSGQGMDPSQYCILDDKPPTPVVCPTTQSRRIIGLC